MNFILEDETKPLTLGASSRKDNTSKIESWIQRRLQQLHKRRFACYKFIQPHSTDWLSAAAHVLPFQNTQEKWTTPTHPVYDQFSTTPADQISLFSNRFSFSIRATAYEIILPLLALLKLQNWTLPPSFCSFDISSLFTNVPQRRLLKSVLTLSTVRSTLLHLFHGKSLLNFWRWLLLLSSLASMTSYMHRQIDGVAMRSPLGPALAKNFIGYYESKLFQTTSNPEMYYRFMYDTFVVFSNKDECYLF